MGADNLWQTNNICAKNSIFTYYTPRINTVYTRFSLLIMGSFYGGVLKVWLRGVASVGP